MKVRLILLLLLVFLGLHSCTMRSVDYRTDQGKLIVRPDWGGYDLPAGTKFYFYNMDGVSAPIEANGSAEGYSGMLPSGSYRMVAYNTDAVQVDFKSMDKFETAAVHALPNTRHVAMREGDVRCILQPKKLYSFTLGNIEVKYLVTTEVEVTPQPLTKTIRLHFTLSGDGAASAKKISGELCGVYPTLLLATGEPTSESINSCAKTTTAFEVILDNNQGTAILTVFGLHNPENGTTYTNRLTLTITKDNGEPALEAKVDLSEAISDVIKDNGGTIPVEIPIDLAIEVKLIGTGLEVNVKPWKDDTGSGEI